VLSENEQKPETVNDNYNTIPTDSVVTEYHWISL